ncbi:holo-ACP synthase [Chitinophaga sp. XS-30]|uniref:holo-ACP synthase n=1 Tax=Chitinophaga sp. XS-30 TaxID=2604421 RepID=UPI0011DD070C|nr:holo-ACP synthase [Chitinophaga sp. XS-30]QEH41411.1 holo-[acyl-carrier-protein] synthase [Chitinophaga sp. XS-30]
MKGIGTDIVEVDRITAKIEKGQGFRELVFSPLEIAYCEKQAGKYESYAARFAAKEAFLKALGTGWAGSGIGFNEIEIRNDEAGKPEIHLVGKARSLLSQYRIASIFVSLSHVKSVAMATVVIL